MGQRARERWPNDPFWRQSLKKNWNEIYGDRRQEIVFIGTDMDELAPLDACLVRESRPWNRAWASSPIRFRSGGAPTRPLGQSVHMDNIVRFVSKSELERERLIPRGARDL